MTNREIRQLCEATQLKQGGEDYPKYRFKIENTEHHILIYWEYLDGKCWAIDKDTLETKDEHNQLMNESFDYNRTLEDTITSAVHYMISRY